MDQIINEAGGLLQHIVSATISGLSNIGNNPASLAFIVAGIAVLSFKKEIKQLIWLAVILFGLGYGSIVLDGIRMLNNVVTQIQP